jgi:TfoX/Sxy family transcriptional regulator of competence genes
MDPAQESLVEELRARLADEPQLREVAMFGGRSFMVREKLAVCALKQGDLLVRVSPDRDADLVDEPDASRAEMGAGRSMGTGWIQVTASALADEQRLDFWLGAALEHNRAATT